MKFWTVRLVLLLSLVAGLSGTWGCDQSATQPASQPRTEPQSLPTISMNLGGKPFTIEVAADNGTREIGLMYRNSMPADHGMIFIFPNEEPLSFWMKNTRIPLDIAYLDKDARVVTIRSMRPYDLTGIDSDKPAKYAIELNLDAAKGEGLKVGDLITIPPDIAASGR